MIARLPKKLRLKRRRDWRAVFQTRCSVSDANLVIYIAANGLEVTRIGLSIGRKVGNAVVRNRAKRRIRAAFQGLRLGWSDPGYDLVCIVRPGKVRTREAYADSLGTLFGLAAEKLARRRGRHRTTPEPA